MLGLLSHNPGGVSNGLKFPSMIALAMLALLVAVRNPGAWAYILRRPSPLDAASLELWLSFGVWPLVLAAAAAAGLTALKRPAGLRRPRPGRIEALAAGLLAFAVFHLLVVSIAPPAAWDVRAYHLALPELYLRSGRMIEVPWLMHSHWPARPALVRDGLVLHQLL